MTHEHDRADVAGAAGHEASMTVHEEQLRAGTERVLTGRVRLRKRVVEEEQTLRVIVRREEVDVIEEDVPNESDHEVGGTAAADETRYDREGSVGLDGPDQSALGPDDDESGDEAELVLFEERPVVTMERVPIERIRLRRVTRTDAVEVSEDVRREVVDLEDEAMRGGRHEDRG